VTFYEHPEFPQYLVTDAGQVFSRRAKRFLKPIRTGEYLGLMITHANGKIVKRYLHLLTLEAVSGPRPAGMVARHLNGNRFDNRAINLAWGTVRQNAADKVRHGTDPSGVRNPMAKLTWEQVRDIRALADGGKMQCLIATQFHVSPMTVSRIIRGQSWRESAR